MQLDPRTTFIHRSALPSMAQRILQPDNSPNPPNCPSLPRGNKNSGERPFSPDDVSTYLCNCQGKSYRYLR